MASLYTFRHLKKVSKFVFHLFKETLMILCDLSLIVSTECWKSDFLYLWKIRSQSQMIHVIILLLRRLLWKEQYVCHMFDLLFKPLEYFHKMKCFLIDRSIFFILNGEGNKWVKSLWVEISEVTPRKILD